MNNIFSTPVLTSNPFVTLEGSDLGIGSNITIDQIMPFDPDKPVANTLPDDATVSVNSDGEIIK